MGARQRISSVRLTRGPYGIVVKTEQPYGEQPGEPDRDASHRGPGEGWGPWRSHLGTLDRQQDQRGPASSLQVSQPQALPRQNKGENQIFKIIQQLMDYFHY